MIEAGLELQACETVEMLLRTFGAATTCFGRNLGLAKRRRCCRSMASCEGMASMTTLRVGQHHSTCNSIVDEINPGYIPQNSFGVLARQLDGPYLNGLITKTTFLLGFQVDHVTLRDSDSIMCDGRVTTESHGSGTVEAMKEVLKSQRCTLQKLLKTREAEEVLAKGPCSLSGGLLLLLCRR
jgi:hypothetical protein